MYKSQIFKAAWMLVKNENKSLSEALKQAWKEAKQAFEASCFDFTQLHTFSTASKPTNTKKLVDNDKNVVTRKRINSAYAMAFIKN